MKFITQAVQQLKKRAQDFYEKSPLKKLYDSSDFDGGQMTMRLGAATAASAVVAVGLAALGEIIPPLMPLIAAPLIVGGATGLSALVNLAVSGVEYWHAHGKKGREKKAAEARHQKVLGVGAKLAEAMKLKSPDIRLIGVGQVKALSAEKELDLKEDLRDRVGGLVSFLLVNGGIGGLGWEKIKKKDRAFATSMMEDIETLRGYQKSADAEINRTLGEVPVETFASSAHLKPLVEAVPELRDIFAEAFVGKARVSTLSAPSEEPVPQYYPETAPGGITYGARIRAPG